MTYVRGHDVSSPFQGVGLRRSAPGAPAGAGNPRFRGRSAMGQAFANLVGGHQGAAPPMVAAGQAGKWWYDPENVMRNEGMSEIGIAMRRMMGAVQQAEAMTAQMYGGTTVQDRMGARGDPVAYFRDRLLEQLQLQGGMVG